MATVSFLGSGPRRVLLAFFFPTLYVNNQEVWTVPMISALVCSPSLFQALPTGLPTWLLAQWVLFSWSSQTDPWWCKSPQAIPMFMAQITPTSRVSFSGTPAAPQCSLSPPVFVLWAYSLLCYPPEQMEWVWPGLRAFALCLLKQFLPVLDQVLCGQQARLPWRPALWRPSSLFLPHSPRSIPAYLSPTVCSYPQGTEHFLTSNIIYQWCLFSLSPAWMKFL